MNVSATVSDSGKRLDQFLQERLSQYSRSRLHQWIKAGRVAVDGVPRKPSYQLRGNESVDVQPAEMPPLHAMPEDLPLDILYEDEAVIAVNKPAGMTVHAGAGRHSGTLVNALVYRFGALSTAGGYLRPGIVHRIDRLTSGVLLIARTDAAHRALAEQFARRTVEKRYIALVHGVLKEETGRITKPVARDPARRTRMTAKLASGRAAVTEYKVLRRFERFTLLEVRLGTGRTHQIRVHAASLGNPVAGDNLYGAPASPYGRHFLHAWRITFDSPAAGDTPAAERRITVEAPLPPELEDWLSKLE